MPKIKDYVPVVSKLLSYFSKNAGLNTVTAAIAPIALVASSGTAPIQELATSLGGVEFAAMVATGTPVGYVAAGLLVLIRVVMGFMRHRDSK